MKTLEVQHVVRELLVEADALSRAAYADHEEETAWRLASLRTTLQRINRRLTSGERSGGLSGELDVAYQRIADVAATARSHKLDHFVAAALRLRARAHGEAPRPVPSEARVATRAADLAPLALGLSALGVTLGVRALRASPVAWCIAASIALGAVYGAVRLRAGAPHPSPRDAATSLDDYAQQVRTIDFEGRDDAALRGLNRSLGARSRRP